VFISFYHTTKNKNQHVDVNAIKFTYLPLDRRNVSGEDIKVGIILNYFRYIPNEVVPL
jgi:hypothetical protein